MAIKTKKAGVQSPVNLTIGQVAKLAKVGIETIRFYEREGIIDEPPRRQSGYREYDPEIIRHLRFIKRAQELGFSLREISQLVAMRVNPKQDCSGVKRRAESKLDEIAGKIEDLKRMHKVLTAVTQACVASKPITDCPILDCFDHND